MRFQGRIMPYFNETLATGLLDLDDQHQQIWDAINVLSQDELSRKDFFAALEVLVVLLEVHMNTENKYMKKFGYPEYLNHMLAHQALTKEIKSIWLKVGESTRGDDVTPQVKKFVKDWLEHHCRDFDSKMIAFFQNHLKKMSSLK